MSKSDVWLSREWEGILISLFIVPYFVFMTICILSIWSPELTVELIKELIGSNILSTFLQEVILQELIQCLCCLISWLLIMLFNELVITEVV